MDGARSSNRRQTQGLQTYTYLLGFQNWGSQLKNAKTISSLVMTYVMVVEAEAKKKEAKAKPKKAEDAKEKKKVEDTKPKADAETKK